MSTSSDIGFLLFMAGFILAYPGALLLPRLAVAKKTATAVLIASIAIGWVVMVIAASRFDYGQSWLDMPASWFFAVLVAIVGVIIIYTNPHPDKQH